MSATGSAIPAHTDHQKNSQLLSWLTVIVLVYLLLVAVGAIGDGFKAATASNAKELFSFATNPFVGLVIGVAATALIQSSSTVTSIIVGMVAGGLPVSIAIPLIMGANIGTSLTSTIVSLGHVRSGDEFRRAFSAATVHDAFNIVAVAIILPLELVFGILEKTSAWLANFFVGSAGVDIKSVNFMDVLISPAENLLTALVSWISSPVWSGIALILIGVGMILFVVGAIGKVLRKVMVGKARDIMHLSVGRGPVSGMGSGAIITLLVQSSSTTTALIVPLAGTGVFNLKQVYPFTLGTNLGTCVTALLAATVVSGPAAVLAMQIAIVHLLFNIFGILIIYCIPFIRPIPPSIATGLAELAQKNKLYVVAYILGVFFVLPLLLIGLSQLF